MKNVRVVVLLLLMTLSNGFIAHAEEVKTTSVNARKMIIQKVHKLYDEIDFGKTTPVNAEVFARAYFGFLNLKDQGAISEEKSLLTICDFSLSSNVPRMWVIDVKKKKVLFHTLVAHGQGTGEEYAREFSNIEGSHQSSVGFFVTKDTYYGDNGYSLRLEGMDVGYNHNAMSRAIVMHGADYVSESFIQANQRLGRSWGCPAVSRKLAKPIIDAIKEGSCLFIYYPDKKYLASSKWLKNTPRYNIQDAIKEQFNNSTDQVKHVEASAVAPASSSEVN
jgi:hypothetical protein